MFLNRAVLKLRVFLYLKGYKIKILLYSAFRLFNKKGGFDANSAIGMRYYRHACGI